MVTHIKELFKGDVVGKFAYPAFNTVNLETTMGIIAAAEEMQVPVIIAASEGAFKYAGLEMLYEIISHLAAKSSVPIALHMDHGKDVVQLKRGIELGFSSIMIDHSNLSFEQNVADTKAMVEFAHQRGAWVQGEIGRIRGSEDWLSVSDAESLLTTPEEAKRFYESTGVDTLAASVGTIHGIVKMRKVKAHVDIVRIQKIHDLVPVPLVLHGASGLPEATMKEAIQAGIAIVNIDTELRVGFTEQLRKFLHDNPSEIDIRKYLNPAIEGIKQTAISKLKVLSTKNIVQ